VPTLAANLLIGQPTLIAESPRFRLVLESPQRLDTTSYLRPTRRRCLLQPLPASSKRPSGLLYSTCTTCPLAWPGTNVSRVGVPKRPRDVVVIHPRMPRASEGGTLARVDIGAIPPGVCSTGYDGLGLGSAVSGRAFRHGSPAFWLDAVHDNPEGTCTAALAVGLRAAAPELYGPVPGAGPTGTDRGTWLSVRQWTVSRWPNPALNSPQRLLDRQQPPSNLLPGLGRAGTHKPRQQLELRWYTSFGAWATPPIGWVGPRNGPYH